jgi:hypothetical protein
MVFFLVESAVELRKKVWSRNPGVDVSRDDLGPHVFGLVHQRCWFRNDVQLVCVGVDRNVGMRQCKELRLSRTLSPCALQQTCILLTSSLCHPPSLTSSLLEELSSTVVLRSSLPIRSPCCMCYSLVSIAIRLDLLSSSIDVAVVRFTRFVLSSEEPSST